MAQAKLDKTKPFAQMIGSPERGKSGEIIYYHQNYACFDQNHEFVEWEVGHEPKVAKIEKLEVVPTVDVSDMTIPQMRKLKNQLTGKGFSPSASKSTMIEELTTIFLEQAEQTPVDHIVTPGG